MDFADPEYLKNHQAETIEVLLKAGLPDGEQLSVDKIDHAQMADCIKMLTGQASGNSEQVSLTYEERTAVRKLAKDRANGRLRNDNEAFAEEVKSLAERIEANKDNYDESRGVVDSASEQDEFAQMIEDLFNDRDRLRSEIAK